MPFLVHRSFLDKTINGQRVFDEARFNSIVAILQETRYGCLLIIYTLLMQWRSEAVHTSISEIIRLVIGGGITKDEILEVFKKLYLNILRQDSKLPGAGETLAARGIDTTLEPEVAIRSQKQTFKKIYTDLDSTVLSKALNTRNHYELPDAHEHLNFIKNDIIVIRYEKYPSFVKEDEGRDNFLGSLDQRNNICTVYDPFFSQRGDGKLYTFRDLSPFKGYSKNDLRDICTGTFFHEAFHSWSLIGAEDQVISEKEILSLGVPPELMSEFRWRKSDVPGSREVHCYGWLECELARKMADQVAVSDPSKRSDFAFKNASSQQWVAIQLIYLITYPDRTVVERFFSEDYDEANSFRSEPFHHDSVVNVLRPAEDQLGEGVLGYKKEEDGWRQQHGDQLPTLETAIEHMEEKLDLESPSWRILKSAASEENTREK